MDLLIYISLFVILAVLFFSFNFTKSFNPALFIILICVIGLVSITLSPPQIVTGANYTISYDLNGNPSSMSSTFLTTDFGYTWAFVLSFLAFLILAVVKLSFSDDPDDTHTTKMG